MKSYPRCVFVLMTISLIGASVDAASFFTDQGSVQVGGAVVFSSTGRRNQDYRYNIFSFEPVLNFFPARHFLLGPVFEINVSGGGGSSNSNFGIGARAGFAYNNNMPVYPFVYVAPQALISAWENRNNSGTDAGFGLNIAGGVMVPARKHFSINFGPGFWMEFNDGWWLNSFYTTVGVTGLIF